MTNIKIEIKNRWTGKVLFDYESENNTVKETIIKAVNQGAVLQGAVLQGAFLQGAFLRGADLQGADLRGAVLQGADLQGAFLQGADLQGAFLQGADLQGAFLQGANLCRIKIKSTIVFTGLYKYIAMPVIAEDGTHYIKLGCHFRTVEDWEKDFWNNPNGFPNDNSIKSQLRVLAYETCKRWLEINDKK